MPSPTPRKRKGTNQRTRDSKSTRPRCGLCRATTNLAKTECCGQWICDDEDQYVLFSYSRNSCSRNHSRYIICGFHHSEGHFGHWKECLECPKHMETEIYVYYGTNEYNFDVLENPPDYGPTKCHRCGAIIVLADGGYSQWSEGYRCGTCMAAEHPGSL